MNEIYNLVAEANQKMYQLWITKIVFSWRWWLNLAITILPWIIWIKFRDKEKTFQLLFVGLVVVIVTNSLDNIGNNLNLWQYDWKVTPFTLAFVPWDFTLFPFAIMSILQIKPKISPYIKAVFFSFSTAFVFEPIYSWIGLYQPIHWKYWYSFIIYIPLYLVFNKIYNEVTKCPPPR